MTIRKQNDEDEAPTSQGTTPTAPQDSGAANDVVTPQSRSDDVDGLVGSESVASIIDDESSTENKLDTPFPLETLKVEISTPPDFKDIYYEIATIKSPYTFQVKILLEVKTGPKIAWYFLNLNSTNLKVRTVVLKIKSREEFMFQV